MNPQQPAYRLVRRPVSAPTPPRLDEAQHQVVHHPAGPLLVLAGPGTGKTSTIVEAVVHRINDRHVDPARVLVLTFSRLAAHELRERITMRLRRTTREPLALTFHSYAYALVRREFVLAGDEPPTLLSGPEQLLEVRRLLHGEAADRGGRWPEQLRPALGTRGFAAELRDFLLRAAERGLDGPGLARLGRQRDRPDWVAAGGFLSRYAARFDLAPVPAYDYAEIVRIAGGLLSRPMVRNRERQAYDVVCVDEYQDTDPAQEQLLHALAGDGRELIVVGDPDQSIYAFRGADADAVRRFPDRFRAPDGSPARVVALRTCRRGGSALVVASRRLARRLPAPLAGMPGEAGGGHRELDLVDGAGPGLVRIAITASAAQEAALIADVLRRAHLIDGLDWSAMAVLVRSSARQLPLLQRALAAAGMPVATAGDELPLGAEPGSRPLLLLLECALRPGALTGETAAELLTGPLGGTDALGLRRLRRALRAAAGTSGEPEASGGRVPGGQAATPADRDHDGDSLLVAALADPRELVAAGLPDDRPALAPALAAARRVADLIALARATAAGGTPEDVLWAVWDASGLAARWRAASAAGGSRGAAADGDLDAVLALFDAAARFAARLPGGSPRLFLDSLAGQEIAGDTLADRAPRGDAVTVLTAHRAKGLEWDLVVVAGVQEGCWPDIRTRSSLLSMDELVDAAAGQAPAGAAADAAAAALASKLLDEERRLFYVAVTRARKALIVTAVGGEDSEDRPSRFLDELAGPDVAIEQVAGTSWLTLPALTAELRGATANGELAGPVRRAAAAQLARLAAAGVRGASPRDWYALTDLTGHGAELFPVDQKAPAAGVRLSPSQVDTFTRCGLRWLLESAAAVGSSSAASQLGMVIHAAAALAADDMDDADIGKRIDEAWRYIDFGSSWYSTRQRERAEQMVRKFLDWHRANPRQLVAAEQALAVRVGQVLITGRVDRLERDERGRAVVVDLKTGTTAPQDDELSRNPQLGVYQLAVLLGAFEQLGLTEPGGAELVQVGKAALAARARVQPQPALADDEDPAWAHRLVETVAAGMSGPVFEARVNRGCQSCPVAACCPVHERGAQVLP